MCRVLLFSTLRHFLSSDLVIYMVWWFELSVHSLCGGYVNFQVRLSSRHASGLYETVSWTSNSSVGDKNSSSSVPGTRTFFDVVAIDDWEPDSLDFPAKIFPVKEHKRQLEYDCAAQFMMSMA